MRRKKPELVSVHRVKVSPEVYDWLVETSLATAFHINDVLQFVLSFAIHKNREEIETKIGFPTKNNKE